MKPLHWGAINPFTGKPFTFDDPNLHWGSPSYYLEPGDPGFVPYGPAPAPPPRKKPFRRKAASKPNHDPQPACQPNTMPTFQYTTRQNPQGGFTTRVALNTPVTDDALLTLISTTAAVTPVQAEAVLRAFATHLRGCTAGCDYSRKFLGLFAFQPTSGGSATAPDGFHNAADINADIAITLTRETIEDWQTTLTLQHMGEVGLLTPVIDSLINQSTGALNLYAAGDLMQVRGDHLKFDRTDLQQGLFLKTAAGVETRCTVYADIEPQSFTFLVPAGTTGAQTVRMAAHLNGSLRSYTYNSPITPA